MFERRLKIFIVLLVVAGVVLFGRAFALQVVGKDRWEKLEQRLSTRPPELTETTRGRILDVNGVPLAVDAACTDAWVDYRAIVDPPDPGWVRAVATARLKQRFGAEFARGSRTLSLADRKALLAEASAGVEADVAEMWATLADRYRPSDPDAAAAAAADPRGALDEVRRAIVRQVEMRRRLLWTNAYRRGQARSAGGGRLARWMGLTTGGGDDGAAPDLTTDADPAAGGPDIDSYAVTTGEQVASHVVLRDLDADAKGLLGKNVERFPGLSLRPSTHRTYPLRDVACHVLGQMGGPTPDELRRTESDDPTTRYEASDEVGREGGVEGLCEPLLRGSRGRIDHAADDTVVDRQDFVPGRDVRLTIDSRLQARAQYLLSHVVEYGKLGDDPHALLTPAEGVSMHAAAVVIDVKTGEVRALASNPGFDVNDLATRYAALNDDVINAPLIDRATTDTVEPGSTVKPLLGLGAVTRGVVGPTEGIECTGYLYLPAFAPDGSRTGRLIKMPRGRCWVVSEYGDELAKAHVGVDHHRVPFYAAHRGIDGNADGWLTLSDAIERSCDIYFETVADRMGPADLCRWYDRFGLGRVTGIGVHEAAGLREDQFRGMVADPRMTNCYAGMGQGKVLATPLQIANAAATIARGGVWMRPRLLAAGTQAALDAARPRPAGSPPDAVDLHLSPAALEQTRVGMRNVVAEFYPGTRRRTGGTGQLSGWDRPAWLTVAAKTGTADVPLFTYLTKTPDGRLVRQQLPAVARGGPEIGATWHRSETGHGAVHAWYMGYAPADDPQVAFAVLVEYAGIGGGVAAAPVAAGLLDACVTDGYLHPPGDGGAAGPVTRPAGE